MARRHVHRGSPRTGGTCDQWPPFTVDGQLVGKAAFGVGSACLKIKPELTHVALAAFHSSGDMVTDAIGSYPPNTRADYSE
jgi:hypothetical protein